MTLKKMMLSGVAALSILSTGALAANNANGTKIATDGTGDYLVFPVYFATTSGWKTNLRVVNTNPARAIVAKVVIREYKTSAEKLDFPIYLTPGDVWEATLETDTNGNVVLKCNDDSMVINGKPANIAPVTKPLYAPVGLENNNIGYVEIFGIGEIDPSNVPDLDGDGNTWKGVGTPEDKEDLYLYYKQTLNGNTNPNGDWSGVDSSSLYGQEVLFGKNQYGSLAMTIPATALEGVTGSEANINPIIGVDTTKDQVIIPDAGQTVDGVVLNIAEALRKTHVYTTYYDDGQGGVAETKLFFTQPMKKYLHPTAPLNASPIGYSFDNAKDGNAAAVSLMDYYFTYSTTPRDMEEHAPVPEQNEFSGGHYTPPAKTCNTEICIWDVASKTGAFTNGYVDFDLSGNKQWYDQETFGIHGIPTLMTAKNVSGVIVTNAIKPAYSK